MEAQGRASDPDRDPDRDPGGEASGHSQAQREAPRGHTLPWGLADTGQRLELAGAPPRLPVALLGAWPPPTLTLDSPLAPSRPRPRLFPPLNLQAQLSPPPSSSQGPGSPEQTLRLSLTRAPDSGLWGARLLAWQEPSWRNE